MATKQTEQVKKRRYKMKEMALVYKGHKCCLCGYSKTSSALEFHHIDPSIKDFSISGKGYRIAWDKTRQELDKCILVCANCHREIHDNLYTNDELQKLLTITYQQELDEYINNCCMNTTVKTCPICNNQFTSPDKDAVYCSVACRAKDQQKASRPSKDVLYELIKTKSFLQIGAEYGVSDNAVRKWCKAYDLPYRKKDLK